MTSSPERGSAIEPLPPALSSMWRLCKLGYRHEPRLMLAAFVLSLLAALPDALLALWLKLLGDGVLEQRPAAGARRGDRPRRVGDGDLVSAHGQHARAAPLPRQGDDRARVARRAAAGVDRDDRAPGAARLSRSAVDAAQPGVRARSHVHVGVLDAAGGSCGSASRSRCWCRFTRRWCCSRVFALPTVLTSTWRPGVERAAQERGAQASRLARHLFTIATTAPPGKEVRVTGIGERLRRASGARRGSAGTRPVAAARWGSAVWHTLAWAIFGGALRRRGRVRRRRACARRPATCCWCSPPARGCRRTSARRSARSDSCAASGWTARGGSRGSRTTPRRCRGAADLPVPGRAAPTASASSTCRSPIPARRASCSTTCR